MRPSLPIECRLRVHLPLFGRRHRERGGQPSGAAVPARVPARRRAHAVLCGAALEGEGGGWLAGIILAGCWPAGSNQGAHVLALQAGGQGSLGCTPCTCSMGVHVAQPSSWPGPSLQVVPFPQFELQVGKLWGRWAGMLADHAPLPRMRHQVLAGTHTHASGFFTLRPLIPPLPHAPAAEPLDCPGAGGCRAAAVPRRNGGSHSRVLRLAASRGRAAAVYPPHERRPPVGV